jgi:glycosyltransferase involved in cell wall biosynthesis
VCFSHLRWDFVYQRPNHLMARAARDRRVFFVEEPRFEPGVDPRLDLDRRQGLTVATPVLPLGLDEGFRNSALARLMVGLFRRERLILPTLWYYTPMALPWTRDLPAGAAVYDSMDYLAGFRGAPPAMLELEADLLERVDVVFCGGVSLHERMRSRHRAVHCFPSSVDVAHFGTARAHRSVANEPADQASIPRPRIGYAGVIDERIDLSLIDGVARSRASWQIVLLGPTAKIDAMDLPRRPNVHHLGMKAYAELPSYLAGWDVGWMPFARNEATRYISPTKTPEYLAAGLTVVSTSIRDVVERYGDRGLVSIADEVDTTVDAMGRALAGHGPDRAAVDRFLAEGSWDRTWAAIAEIIDGLEAPIRRRPAVAIPIGGAKAISTRRRSAACLATGAPASRSEDR